jgi:hypothetical protein
MKNYISCTKKQRCGSALVSMRAKGFDDQILKKFTTKKDIFQNQNCDLLIPRKFKL